MATSQEDDQSARAAFERWASQQEGSPRQVLPLIGQVETSHDFAGLLATDIAGRRVVWRAVSASSRARITTSSIAIEDVDAWNVEANVLRLRSEHIAICAACAGEKKVRCSACNGLGKGRCGACNGQRKAYGYAADGSRRLLNCTACRGKGEIDCDECRRGIMTCKVCAGEGRMQRWIELETWRRTAATVHPDVIARQLGWQDDLSGADITIDIDRPHRLAASDLGGVPAQWLDALAPALEPGERIARQRLRIARVPTFTVHYRLGADDDRIAFAGHGLAPPQTTTSAFTRRAAKLRLFRRLLIVIGIVLAILSLARGTFFWSLATLSSLAALTGALGAMYGLLADWTAARRHTRHWIIAAGAALVVALAFTIAALPRLGHAQQLITAGKLDVAEAELKALGDRATADSWAELRVARIREATPIQQARVRQKIAQSDYPGAAKAIVDARSLGVAPAALQPMTDAIYAAAVDAATRAKRLTNPRLRLRRRLAAEQIFVAWELASQNWGTPPLIELRTEMAGDVAAVERGGRRRRSP